MSPVTRFEARMVVAADAKIFGWLVVLALLAAALPIVMVVQRHPLSVGVLGLCLAGAAALGFAAWRLRTSGLHEVRLERQGDEDVLVVDGSRVRLALRGPLGARALRAQVVASSGRRTARILTHVLIIEQGGRPALVLEEAVATADDSFYWKDSTDADFDYGDAPVLCKSIAPAHLEKLRTALAV